VLWGNAWQLCWPKYLTLQQLLVATPKFGRGIVELSFQNPAGLYVERMGGN